MHWLKISFIIPGVLECLTWNAQEAHSVHVRVKFDMARREQDPSRRAFGAELHVREYDGYVWIASLWHGHKEMFLARPRIVDWMPAPRGQAFLCLHFCYLLGAIVKSVTPGDNLTALHRISHVQKTGGRESKLDCLSVSVLDRFILVDTLRLFERKADGGL